MPTPLLRFWFASLCLGFISLGPAPAIRTPGESTFDAHSVFEAAKRKSTDRGTATVPQTQVRQAEPDQVRQTLAEYVAQNPDDVVMRIRYAELLLKLHCVEEAAAEFERAIGTAQEGTPPQLKLLIHCHSRLMELAMARDDEYGERLHRGIGLYHLARRCGTDSVERDKLNEEGLLCQAAAELSLARLREPGEARPCLYLYEVWSRLGQARPARCNLLRAEEVSVFASLTAFERCRLHLASRMAPVSMQAR
jgi:hypothetical protein